MSFDQECLREIMRRIREQRHPLVTIDGPCASGKTTIEDIHHIKRGYYDIVGKLRSVGADIREVSVADK